MNATPAAAARQPIDLVAIAGDRYRIEYDPAFEAQGRGREEQRAWLVLIPGRYGHVYPFSADRLAAYVAGRLQPNKVKLLPFAEVHQDGDGECTVLFEPQHLDRIAPLVGLRRRRQLSADHKRKLTEASKPYRFRHGSNGQSQRPESIRTGSLGV